MQITDTVLMVEPAAFSFNPETAGNNHFQNKVSEENLALQSKALEEFQAFVALLRKNGIRVIVIKDTADPQKPDAIFPNNWFVTDSNRITVFPLYAPNRRLEKREEILAGLKENFAVEEVIDWGRHEKDEIFLEGTGSMVIDRANHLIYACLSPRTDKKLLEAFASANNSLPVVFSAFDDRQRAIYHTNVMMCIGEGFAVLCADAITDDEERKHVIASLSLHHDVILISQEQMNAFAGNMLHVKNEKGDRFVVMSATAFRSLRPLQLHKLQRYGKLIVAEIPTIESVAGGGVRCMMAEIFLEKTKALPG